MTPDLWEEINRWARDELRSVNGQIEYLLWQAVRRRRSERQNDPPPPSAEDANG
jgi:hypothetical protein